MCRICGCSTDRADGHALAHDVANDEGRDHLHHHHGPRPDGAHPHRHDHAHPHDHDHAHPHPQPDGDPHHGGAEDAHRRRLVRIEREILGRNDRLAEANRRWLAGRGVTAFNLMSSPGSGKTTLVERLVRELGRERAVMVIEGDQATDRDARRVREAGAQAIQINTGTACHLDAAMVRRALGELDPPPGALVIIENVGNLVCPALFDLGEHAKVVVASVTEGEDKPIKYPHMFQAAQALVLNKIDLLPHVDFDVDRFAAFAREVNPAIEIFPLSARSGEGLEAFRAFTAGRE